MITADRVKTYINNAHTVICSFCCSSYYVIDENKAICNRCEMPYTKEQISDSYQSIVKGALDIEEEDKILKRLGELESLYSSSKDIKALYIKALLEIKLSNIYLKRIAYSKEGFMEENAKLRLEATKLYALAKADIIRFIESVDDASDLAMYKKAIAYFKLNNLTAVRYYSNKIDDIFLKSYLKMLLDLTNGDKKDLANLSEWIFSAGSLNGIFYNIIALIKQERIDQADKLFKVYKDIGSSSDIEKIESMIAEYRSTYL
ncbi:MAG: hypothetical protein ARM1_0173 [Candidatus Micrarchaeota archaeon]|nr:MAG: hypothetical protein ARM1_0173 [Candidatus Micrarchaeota archaeon]